METVPSAPLRPTEHAERALIHAILNNTYPAGSKLPAERQLAAQLGVTRPPLREALQRMERDGWITIQQGKPTQVRDIWTAGGLNILNTLARYAQFDFVENPQIIPFDFVRRLLEVRLALAPAYARGACAYTAPEELGTYLQARTQLAETAADYCQFDWELHHHLTTNSGNPIYTLILNGFKALYIEMGKIYFSHPQARAASQTFYKRLAEAIAAGDVAAAEECTRTAMAHSLKLWEKLDNTPEQ